MVTNWIPRNTDLNSHSILDDGCVKLPISIHLSRDDILSTVAPLEINSLISQTHVVRNERLYHRRRRKNKKSIILCGPPCSNYPFLYLLNLILQRIIVASFILGFLLLQQLFATFFIAEFLLCSK